MLDDAGRTDRANSLAAAHFGAEQPSPQQAETTAVSCPAAETPASKSDMQRDADRPFPLVASHLVLFDR
jgi:hypothetical protein